MAIVMAGGMQKFPLPVDSADLTPKRVEREVRVSSGSRGVPVGPLSRLVLDLSQKAARRTAERLEMSVLWPKIRL